MAEVTVTRVITRIANDAVTAATANSTHRVPSQGGVFEGSNPTTPDPKNPITLFIIQASIVVALTRTLYWPLAKINQPPVMAEVITGILLGPSVMGRVPGFTQHIFPTASMPPFSLAANLGLVLYLFLVGLEVDLRLLNRNWRVALSVGMLGMILPFGLGAAIAHGLYQQFRDENGVVEVEFSVYLLFIGVAMAITAFPVLCRILTSLNLLGTTVGVIVLSAGIGNDVVGWILLALCVTLINSGASLTAFWILLACTGYCIFVAFPVRWAFVWLLRHTGSLVNGPTQSVVAITIMLVLASAFFTQIIGVHAIFGAFLIGLICPHGIFAIKLQEKIEDLISVLFLPLYFALSGLNTNLALLDSGVVWGYVIGVCVIALTGKIVGGAVAARLNGLVWRESLAVGCLMSCKGLVELIVLNIGFQARILSQRTFTIFVVMALITTFTATPLVVWIYPAWYQTKIQLWKEGKIDWSGNHINHNDGDSSQPVDADALRGSDVARKVLLYLRLDSLSTLFTMVVLFAGKEDGAHSLEVPVFLEAAKNKEQEEDAADTSDARRLATPVFPLYQHRQLQIHGLRLMELTERESSVMKASEIEQFTSRDPVIRAFSTFGHSQDTSIDVSGQISIVPERSFSDEIIARARDLGSDFILLPWSETGTMSEYKHPFEAIAADPLANFLFTDLAAQVYRKAEGLCDVGVLLNWNVLSAHRTNNAERAETSCMSGRPDRSISRTRTTSLADQEMGPASHFGLSGTEHYHIIVPFTGSRDDLCAVRLGFQFANKGTVEVTVLDLRSHGVGAAVNLANQMDVEFGIMKSSLLPGRKNKVSFVEDIQALSPLNAIVAAVLQPTSGEKIVLAGRNSTSLGSTRDLSRDILNTKSGSSVLGQWGTMLANWVIEQSISTTLLVVQACRDAKEEEVAAKEESLSAHLA